MKPLKLISLVLFACSSMTVAQTSTTRDLIQLENRFNQALVRADVGTIEEIEANDLVFTDAAGVVTGNYAANPWTGAMTSLPELRMIVHFSARFVTARGIPTRNQPSGRLVRNDVVTTL
jgi:hypothetical protein